MMDLPLVSICIPTYNAARYFEACLNSAINQTYANTEILISDDGSTDGTLAIIERYQKKYSRVKLVKNPFAGMVTNWNYCIEQASGQWIKFLFQDDLLEPACVAEMLEACTKHQVQVAVCRRDFIVHEDATEQARRDFSKGIIPKAEDVFSGSTFINPVQLAQAVKAHLLQNFLGEPTCYLFNKGLLQSTAFNTDLKQVVDYEFIVRLGLMEGMAFLPDTLAHFRVHGGSETTANTGSGADNLLRTIAAVTGDFLLLLNLYATLPDFRLVRQEVGSQVITETLKHIYYSSCKHKGSHTVNEALRPLREKYPHLAALRYHFFKYAYYRFLHKKREKENKDIRLSQPQTGIN